MFSFLFGSAEQKPRVTYQQGRDCILSYLFSLLNGLMGFLFLVCGFIFWLRDDDCAPSLAVWMVMQGVFCVCRFACTSDHCAKGRDCKCAQRLSIASVGVCWIVGAFLIG